MLAVTVIAFVAGMAFLPGAGIAVEIVKQTRELWLHSDHYEQQRGLTWLGRILIRVFRAFGAPRRL